MWPAASCDMSAGTCRMGISSGLAGRPAEQWIAGDGPAEQLHLVWQDAAALAVSTDAKRGGRII
jgi:hypothetical protein